MNVERLSVIDYPEINDTGYYYQLTQGRLLSDRIHNHEFYEIIIVFEGECIHNINGISYKYETGDIVLLRPDDIHYFTSQSRNNNIMALSVSGKEINKFFNVYNEDILNEINKLSLPVRYKLNNIRNEFIILANLVMKTHFTHENYTDRNKIILNLVVTFYITYHLPKVSNKMPDRFMAAIYKMQSPENIREGMRALLRISNYSHVQLCRLMKQYINMTPVDYIISLRMSLAYDLVTGSDLNFDHICEEAGYASFSYFSKLFHKTYGITLTQARNARQRKILTV